MTWLDKMNQRLDQSLTRRTQENMAILAQNALNQRQAADIAHEDRMARQRQAFEANEARLQRRFAGDLQEDSQAFEAEQAAEQRALSRWTVEEQLGYAREQNAIDNELKAIDLQIRKQAMADREAAQALFKDFLNSAGQQNRVSVGKLLGIEERAEAVRPRFAQNIFGFERTPENVEAFDAFEDFNEAEKARRDELIRFYMDGGTLTVEQGQELGRIATDIEKNTRTALDEVGWVKRQLSRFADEDDDGQYSQIKRFRKTLKAAPGLGALPQRITPDPNLGDAIQVAGVARSSPEALEQVAPQFMHQPTSSFLDAWMMQRELEKQTGAPYLGYGIYPY